MLRFSIQTWNAFLLFFSEKTGSVLWKHRQSDTSEAWLFCRRLLRTRIPHLPSGNCGFCLDWVTIAPWAASVSSFRGRIWFPSQVHLKSLSCVQLFATHGPQLTRLLCLWDFPDKDTGVVCHFLLQRIFLTQGSNLGLLHCRQIFYQLSHQLSDSLYYFLTSVLGSGC